MSNPIKFGQLKVKKVNNNFVSWYEIDEEYQDLFTKEELEKLLQKTEETDLEGAIEFKQEELNNIIKKENGEQL